mmetsp:Transcript_95286/g.278594  ORF Transcript_95286/g.278594 Transcript_95286/m.278594 type:complete len:215 (-) Transcript_95286:59-703(-)
MDLGDLGPQLHVRQDAVLPGHLPEVLQEVVPRRPGLHGRSWSWICSIVLQMVDSELGLQLGSGICILHPGRPSDGLEAVINDKVVDPLFQVAQGRPEAAVPSANDAVRMRVLHDLPRPLPDPLDNHVAPHLLNVEHLPKGRGLPDDEGELLRLDAKLAAQAGLELTDLGVDCQTHGLNFSCPLNGQLDFSHRVALGAEPRRVHYVPRLCRHPSL